jgi:aminoglycoside phosphotransferase (APT) family kinase protein
VTCSEAEQRSHEWELVRLRALEHYLDSERIGTGAVRVRRIGDGASNLTYRISRGGRDFVLRCPPPPPLPPSAHDVVREARIQVALGGGGVPVPGVLAICEDADVVGVPFYVMEYIDGVVLAGAESGGLDDAADRRRVGLSMVETLARLHAHDWRGTGVGAFGKPGGYLARQLRRWSGLWEISSTRDLPEIGSVAERLAHTMPEGQATTVVHGDFRLGNVMLSRSSPVDVVAVLDWEMATLGDPLADLGYLIESWSEPGVASHPLMLSPVTAQPGFPSRAELIAH